MHDATTIWLAILAMGAITFGLRALPFMAGRWLRRHPIVHVLGERLPLAIMVLLLIDTLASQARANPGGPWQEVLAVALVGGLQWVWRQPLLSILAGTALYIGLRLL